MKNGFITLRKAIPASLLLAGAVGLSANASASVYAISYNNLNDVLITSEPFVPPTDFTSFSAVSNAAANLNGDGSSGSDTSGGPVSSPLKEGTGSVYAGAGPTDDGFTAQSLGGNYSYADSQIPTTALLQPVQPGPVIASGDLTQAVGIAEGYIDSSGNGDSDTRNSSETGFDSTVSVTEGAQFTFDFEASPYLAVAMSADAVGISSNAVISVVATITNLDTQEVVFRWTPDGTLGTGIIGGTETADGVSLNTSVEVTSPGMAFYNPLGNAAPSGDITGAGATFAQFTATTDALAAGRYSISLDMTESMNLSTVRAIPAPGALALMGLGLMGLGFSRRRRS